MSKITITLELDGFICSELEDVREMVRTLDFSGLTASVERIQKHANAMEMAIRNYNSYLQDIKNVFDGKADKYDSSESIERNSEEKLSAIEEILKKKYLDW